MKYLIQNNLFDEKRMETIGEALADLPKEYIGVVPFSYELTCNEEIQGVDYIPYGSTHLLKIASDLGWRGLYFDEDLFNYKTWIDLELPMLNEFYGTVEEVLENLTEVGVDVFMKPAKNIKSFDGRIFSSKGATKFLESALIGASSISAQLSKDDLLIIDDIKPIEQEWRVFIVDKLPISISSYRKYQMSYFSNMTNPALLKFVDSIIERWLPFDNVALDVCLVDKEFKIVEFNAINSSGFYNHDVKKIFTELYNYERSYSN